MSNPRAILHAGLIIFFSSIFLLTVYSKNIVYDSQEKNSVELSIPSPPNLISPSDKSVDVSTALKLTWSKVTGVDSYQVQISINSNFNSNIFDQQGIVTTSINVDPALPEGTTFYWRVSAKNNEGTSNWSTVRRFTTIINETKLSTIDFSGVRWNINSGYSGPGPNYWFNGINSVWTDNLGNLHLTIRKIGDKWYCASIVAQDTMGYGEYSFSLYSDVEKYDPNIVVGLFVYETDTKEIDIEFSRWSDVTSKPGWYVIQPATSKNSSSFNLNLQGRSSVHKFLWKKDEIKFQSFFETGELIKEWIYTGSNIPIPLQSKAHINFWLVNGSPPTDLYDSELIIKNFKYTSLQLVTDILLDNIYKDDFKLFQNYPNPFNGESIIEYQIPSPGIVTLKIYDLLGREISTLVNEYKSAGNYTSRFSQSNLNLSGGIYFYRIAMNGHSVTRKMIFIK